MKKNKYKRKIYILLNIQKKKIYISKIYIKKFINKKKQK